MPDISCPTALVDAPIAIVWGLLVEPAEWAAFFDLRLNRIDPPGSAIVGQTVYGESGPRLMHFVVTLRFTHIDAERRTMGIDVQLPLGITVREDLGCSAVSDNQCRVDYRCAFGFPRGWRSAIARVVLRRELIVGPADSLSRLKRAAELRYSQVRN